jgi:hypothetical protein
MRQTLGNQAGLNSVLLPVNANGFSSNIHEVVARLNYRFD